MNRDIETPALVPNVTSQGRVWHLLRDVFAGPPNGISTRSRDKEL